MRQVYLRLSTICCLVIFTLSSRYAIAQTRPQDFLSGSWIGYIKIDGKAVYKVNILTGEDDKKKLVGDIYYLTFTKKVDGVRQDSLQINMNNRDTSISFEIKVPNPPMPDCPGIVTIRRADLYNQTITTTFKPTGSCKSVEIFLNDFQTMINDPVYANAPDANIIPKTGTPPKAIIVEAGNNSQQAPLTFTINPKDVTHSTDKDFKWYDWDKAPKDLIAATHFIHTFKNRQTQVDEILYDDIMNNINNYKCTVRIAAADLDEDGICGIAYESSGMNCCGSMGCTFGLYDNGGLKVAGLLTDHGPSPDKNRVKASTGDFYSLKANNITVDAGQIEKLFKYARPAGAQTTASTPVIPKNLVGGATPDELGRQMLKALQTNNKKLWASCLHPTYQIDKDPGRIERETNMLDQIREYFEAKGISDWKKVSFSRVISDVCSTCAPPGEKWLSEMVVEFWYQGHEFLGMISFTPVFTYKGKYFVGRNYDHEFKRYK